MTLAKRRRSAFTLIELLVVIAILTALAALSAGTYFRIRSGEQVKSTESTLEKLNSGLERLQAGDRDQAEKEFTSGKLIAGATMEKLLGFAGGPNEKDRAKAIYLYFRMKYEYPQTFPEAKATVTLAGAGISAPPKQMFKNLPNVTPTTADEANFQAAVLLHLILSEKSSRGETFDAASLQGFTAERSTTASGTHRVFIDSWGSPVTYVRFLTDLVGPPAEIDGPPHARGQNTQYANAASMTPGVSNSPFDVSAKLVSNSTNTIWNGNFPLFVATGGIAVNPNGANLALRQEQLLRKNFVPCVISAGANKTWDGLDVRGYSASPYSNVGIVQYGVLNGLPYAGGADDNILGYRLRKFGARGD